MEYEFVKKKKSSSRSEKRNIKIYNKHFFLFIDKNREIEYNCTQRIM